jgi:hypothetical protein
MRDLPPRWIFEMSENLRPLPPDREALVLKLLAALRDVEIAKLKLAKNANTED